MLRRRLLLGAIAGIGTARAIAASGPPAGFSGGTGLAVPYETVPAISEQAGRVAFFYAYSCPFCRQYYPLLVQLAETLPRTVKFLWSPLGAIPSLNHFAIRKVAPEKQTAFEEAVFTAVAEGKQETDGRVYLDAAVKLGVDRRRYVTAAVTKEAQEFGRRAMQRALDYQVNKTPTVGIDGRYRITPDNTNGEPEQFMLVINGLISQMLGA